MEENSKNTQVESFFSKEKIDLIIKILLFIYLFMLPLHYILFNILLNSISILKIWKEVIILVMIILTTLKYIKKYPKNYKYRFSNSVSLCAVIFLGISFIYLLMSPNKFVAASILRVYSIPVVLYFIIKEISFSEEELIFSFKLLLIEAIAIAIYGIFQSLFLGPNFLIDLGYPIRENGRLSTSFYLSGMGDYQRTVGTFVSSNTFAFYTSIFFIMCLYTILHKKKVEKKLVFFGLVITLFGLFFSFSRSSWIATFFTSIIIIYDANRKKKIQISFKRISAFLGLLVVFSLCMIVTLSVLSNNNLLELLYNFVLNTVGLKDTSAISHISSFVESAEIFINNIFGTGLGMNGPKAASYFNNFFQTESSYFLILFDFGIFGFVFYYLIYILVPIKFYKSHLEIPLANYLMIFALIGFIFLPYVQDLEIISYIFIILGISVSNISFIENKPINILLLHSSAEFYGSDKSLYNLVINLSNNDNFINNVHVILPTEGILQTKISNDSNDKVILKTHDLGVLRRKNFCFTGIIKYFFEYIFSLIFLIRYIQIHNINVVYTNTSVVMSGGLAAKLLSVKNIWHIRETLDRKSLINKIIIAYISFLSDEIIANSKSTLINFSNKKLTNSHVVYNAVNPIEEKKGTYTFSQNEFIIGMAGRINSWKGQEVFIDAAYKVKQKIQGSKIKFLIAGDAYQGDEKLVTKLRDKIDNLSMQNDIFLLGQVDDMSGFYNSIDIFVLPSTKPEPFGLVIIEAMSLGIPVIASDQGGPVEIIDNNNDGILFKTSSSEDLSNKIIELMENADKFSKIKKNAKDKQRNKFSIESYYSSIYRIIIGG